MSDSTATAREPSMEDILASIRRIIDEEDTRDARPASDLAMDDGRDAEAGTPPVMAAAPVARDDAPRATGGGEDGQVDDRRERDDAPDGEQDGTTIFPERESLFWSRATGRGEGPAEASADPDDAPGTAGRAGPRTDIFRRAQSKLGSAQRPGARERIQSLAARAEERAESVAHERGSLDELAGLSDRVESDAAEDARSESASAVAALADAGSVEGVEADPHRALDESGVLDLTEPLDPADPSEGGSAEAAARFDGLSDDEDRMDIARDGPRDDDAAEKGGTFFARDPESLRGMTAPRRTVPRDDAPDARGSRDDATGAAVDEHAPGTTPEAEDVFELTTPLTDEAETVDTDAGTGSVENGDSFHVSDVVEKDGQEAGHDVAAAGMAQEPETGEDRAGPDDAPADAPEDDDRPDARANTYSRFDSEPVASATYDEEAPSEEVFPEESFLERSGRDEEAAFDALGPDDVYAEPEPDVAEAAATHADADMPDDSDADGDAPDDPDDSDAPGFGTVAAATVATGLAATYRAVTRGGDAEDAGADGAAAEETATHDERHDEDRRDDEAVYGTAATEEAVPEESVADETVADETLADEAGHEDDGYGDAGVGEVDAARDDAAGNDDRSATGWVDADPAMPDAESGAPGPDAFDAPPPVSDEPDPYAAAFTMLDDRLPAGADEPSDRLDDLDMGDELGFSDTFSASDVYHDDPPEFDGDYSRSFEVEDEPVAARAAHGGEQPDDGASRGEGHRDDGHGSDGHRDDGMEKVGGLVRDAMERDPVDYADPSALVSMTSEEISARALASLADVEGEASRRMFGSLRISDEDGSESLEGMVRGMLRPLLREWLDDNLPTMVESAVRGEVERISAKSRKYSRAADRD